MLFKFFGLALKNIILYRRRSLLTGTVMTCSVAILFLGASLGESLYHQLVNVGISTTTGHIMVTPKGWEQDLIQPIGGQIPTIPEIERVEQIIRQVPHYQSHGREIVYQLLLFDKTDTFFQGAVMGVEANKIKEILYGVRLTEGDDIEQGVRDGVLISPVAREFFNKYSEEKLVLDDRMYILTGDPLGMLDGIKTRFKGVAQTMPIFGNSVVVTNIKAVQSLLGWGENDCTTIKIILQDKNYTDTAAAWLETEIFKSGLPLQVSTWKQTGGFFYHIALLGRFLVLILLLIIAVITAITVSNTMMMSVKERTREIGTIMALGVKGRGIVTIFVVESFVLATMFTLIGSILGIGLVLLFGEIGFLRGVQILVEGALYPKLDPLFLLLSFLWIVLMGTIGGSYPAYRASKLNPITALRHV